MNPADYTHNVFQAIAASQLQKAGVDVSAGQTVKYLIVDARNRRADRRVRVAELLERGASYDQRKYLDLLLTSGSNLLSMFGYTTEALYQIVTTRERQLKIDV
jgi:DNA polymerase elongation subunit (family B)